MPRFKTPQEAEAEAQPGLVVVRSVELKGKTVNLPHSEHYGGANRAAITFNEKGVARVPAFQAQALLEFYPKQVELA